MVVPGFYDGFTPLQPYNWVCPPVHIGGNQPPKSGHLSIDVIGGVSDANSGFTDDNQLVIGFLPGSFQIAGGTKTITVDIAPLSPCPAHPHLTFVTNIYHVTASVPLIKSANLVLSYSDIVPAPSEVYFASDPGGPWKSIGVAPQSQPFTIDTSTKELGYFAGGYAADSTPAPGAITVGGGQVLPIAVAVLIIGVIVAGIPLAIIRRRQSATADDGGEDEDDDGEP
jgi:hypothetical protein